LLIFEAELGPKSTRQSLQCWATPWQESFPFLRLPTSSAQNHLHDKCGLKAWNRVHPKNHQTAVAFRARVECLPPKAWIYLAIRSFGEDSAVARQKNWGCARNQFAIYTQNGSKMSAKLAWLSLDVPQSFGYSLMSAGRRTNWQKHSPARIWWSKSIRHARSCAKGRPCGLKSVLFVRGHSAAKAQKSMPKEKP